MNLNRRLQERKQPERIVFCKLDGEESSSVMNLSEDGLCFESLTPIEEKGLLQLRLSVDLNSAIEATGQLAWIDSAKRTGGLGFLELSVPAREQTRAWLSETSTASSGRDWGAFLQQRDKQAGNGTAIEKPVLIPLMYLTIGLWPLVWLMNWMSYYSHFWQDRFDRLEDLLKRMDQ